MVNAKQNIFTKEKYFVSDGIYGSLCTEVIQAEYNSDIIHFINSNFKVVLSCNKQVSCCSKFFNDNVIVQLAD